MLQKRQPGLAGLLRENVTLQQQAVDANGDRLGGWMDVFVAAARVVAKTRGEQVLDQRLAGVQPLEVTVRADINGARIDTDWRLVWRGLPYDISAVAPDELGVTITLLAVRAREVAA